MTAMLIRNIDICESGFLVGLAPNEFVDRLAEEIVGFVRRVVAGHSSANFAHYICSSTFDIVCSGGWFEPVALTSQVRQQSGLPCAYSNAMQCATWGFLVRQHLTHKPSVQNVLISVVDGNPLGMRFWEDNVAWGKTGHRITHLHLYVGQHSGAADRALGCSTDAIMVGQCNPSAALYDYVLEMNKAVARYPSHTLAMPYFEKKMRKGLQRSMSDGAYLPDLYEQFGHLCGTDPWLSIARDVTHAGARDKHYLASSFASQGYCCFLSAKTDAQSMIRIESQV